MIDSLLRLYRRSPRPLDNVSPRAQQLLALARKQADRLGHSRVNTEHLLLALLEFGEGVGCSALRHMNVDLDALQKELREAVPPGTATGIPPSIPCTPAFKAVLHRGSDEALRLGHKHLGTEHLLLGLLHSDTDLASILLMRHGLTLDNTRDAVGAVSVPAPATMPHSIEIKLALDLVRPALALLREQADKLRAALGTSINGGHVTEAAIADIDRLLWLFSPDFEHRGSILIEAEATPKIIRACSLLRLHLRKDKLSAISDGTLAAGTNTEGADADAFAAYVFVGTIQELVLQHFACALAAESAPKGTSARGGLLRRLGAFLGLRRSASGANATSDSAGEPEWAVVVLDDPVNTMSYVTLVFRRVLCVPEETARRLMQEVHELGRSVVWTGAREEAERHTRRLQIWHLNAILEPRPSTS